MFAYQEFLAKRQAARRSSSPCAYLHMAPRWHRPSCQNMPRRRFLECVWRISGCKSWHLKRSPITCWGKCSIRFVFSTSDLDWRSALVMVYGVPGHPLRSIGDRLIVYSLFSIVILININIVVIVNPDVPDKMWLIYSIKSQVIFNSITVYSWIQLLLSRQYVPCNPHV